jgi:hypothetical protein
VKKKHTRQEEHLYIQRVPSSHYSAPVVTEPPDSLHAAKPEPSWPRNQNLRRIPRNPEPSSPRNQNLPRNPEPSSHSRTLLNLSRSVLAVLVAAALAAASPAAAAAEAGMAGRDTLECLKSWQRDGLIAVTRKEIKVVEEILHALYEEDLQ